MALSHYISNDVFDKLLTAADREERLALTQVVNSEATVPLPPGELKKQMSLAAGHSVFNALRGGEGISYAEMLSDACDTLKVEGRRSYFSSPAHGVCIADADRSTAKVPDGVTQADRKIAVLEYIKDHQKMLLSKLMVDLYTGLTADQRRKVDAELDKLAKDNGLVSVSQGAALLALGNAGGFATYTLMSTLLSAVSFGTLSFGAYTFASTALSVVLGPVGWIALGAYAANKLGAPSSPKVVRMAATCSMVYERLVTTRALQRIA
ncbi:hypothetical protein [Ramlibacter rhizophilus]|uniref:DUF3944 domain-containing protein n=1 Tax=Ramlibacter rhizophilus TaxID=1781167 RepID=A0A4Z0BWX2_9BURK|nr:hypothetical protein [Ramlibacter rhizophilus]TFZ03401.1 hypothetical protein EZ242_05830 [Ramlibacter rhizophilus]